LSLISVSFAVNMALEPSSQTRANVSDSEHKQQWNTCYGTVTLFYMCLSHSFS